MANLEDHLRGFKKENLIGHSDSEHEQSDDEATTQPVSPMNPPRSDGLPHTGPKGVLTDYYRNMEEMRQRDLLEEKSRKEMIILHSATVQSHSDEASEAAAMMNVARALEDGSLDQDPFLRDYRAKRITEMKKQASLGSDRKRFGNLVEVRGDKYDTLIDDCPHGVLLLIHIYNELYVDCVHMNKCLTHLAKLYPTAKICRVQCALLDLSQSFMESALPTLMVYRDGEIIGNYVRIIDNLGTTYSTQDLEHFLQEKNCLPPESDREDTDLIGSSGKFGGAMKILGVSKYLDSD